MKSLDVGYLRRDGLVGYEHPALWRDIDFMDVVPKLFVLQGFVRFAFGWVELHGFANSEILNELGKILEEIT